LCVLDTLHIRGRFDGVFVHDRLANGDVNVWKRDDDGGFSPYVCVRDSSTPCAGKGLFTCRHLRAREVFGVYCGEVLGWSNCRAAAESQSSYLADFTLFVDRVSDARRCVVVDGGRPPQSARDQRAVLALTEDYPVPCGAGEWPGMFAHFMNDAQGPARVAGLVNNCAVDEDGLVRALSDIPGCSFEHVQPSSELLWAYGASFWGRP
jgi:hypothetical protein